MNQITTMEKSNFEATCFSYVTWEQLKETSAYTQVHTVTTADNQILRLQLQLIIELDGLRILQITQQN